MAYTAYTKNDEQGHYLEDRLLMYQKTEDNANSILVAPSSSPDSPSRTNSTSIRYCLMNLCREVDLIWTSIYFDLVTLISLSSRNGSCSKQAILHPPSSTGQKSRSGKTSLKRSEWTVRQDDVVFILLIFLPHVPSVPSLESFCLNNYNSEPPNEQDS